MDSWKPTKKPTNPIEETFVFEMVTTLWRLRRQAPAESNLMKIQMQRMLPVVSTQFDYISPSALYALAVAELQANGDALNQIARQGRRLLTQYEKLTQQLLNMRQLFPPVTPEPPNLQPHPDLEPQNNPVEANLTEDQLTENQSTENEAVEKPSVEIKPVGTKLTNRQRPGSVLSANTRSSLSLHLPLSRETRVHIPQSILYAALPPISQPAKPAPTKPTEAPTKVYSAGHP